jgi:EAL domain-containing protein (putative c-di-GMP-specific phosphodiesterase class I)
MWLDMGYHPGCVSVNVSRAHFAEKDLAIQIRDMVNAAGCPHDLLEIELTESAFFDDQNAMIETIKALKSFGFKVSMDDFGAGYSSLNSLKDMPLDVLKLDAGFFRGDKAGDRGGIVVAETIKLAKSLHMKTVAEGVEEKEQVEFLASQGCDMIQGYYFAKPMPKSDYMQQLAGLAGAAVAAPAAPMQTAPAVPVASAPSAAPQPLVQAEPVQPATPQPQ